MVSRSIISKGASLDDLGDFECTVCRGPLLWNKSPNKDEICYGAIKCQVCNGEYDLIYGIPFLGYYEPEDILGLLEIAATARPENTYADGPTIRRLERLLRVYHEAPDREAFVKSEPDDFVRAPWFSHRYSEWLEFTELTKDISFAGMNVLDVGAGTGFDACRLAMAGAKVTALEYSPVLCRRGADAVPEARWIGGFAHVLPFASGSFEAVCCNAALHHMRDVSASLREMLRVLKPGGWLITTGDPFRSRTSNISKEFEVFNRHPDVLLGVNESIPSFTAFETVLLHYRPLLEIRLVTSGVLYGARFGKLKLKTDIAGLREWDFDKDRQMLGDTSGGLGICCRLRKLTGDASPRQAQAAIGAGAFAAVLSDYSAAIRRLAPLIPAEEVDRGFPGTEQSKVELLNGWQAPDGSDVRNAFRRARWFLRRPKSNDPLSFQVRYEHAANRSSSLNVLIDGQLLMRHELTSEWKDVSVSIGSVAPGDIFVCELQLDLEPTPDSPSFDDELFQVRRRQIAGTIGAVNVRKSWLARSLTKLLDGRNGRHR